MLTKKEIALLVVCLVAAAVGIVYEAVVAIGVFTWLFGG